MTPIRLWALGIGLLMTVSQTSANEPVSNSPPDIPSDAQKVEFFEKKIRPLLSSHCYTCHSASTNARGGLRVDERRGILTGGNRGSAVIPASPEKSLLLKAIRHEKGVPSMPPGEKLGDSEIALLEKWILDGAVWPAGTISLDQIAEDQSHYKDLLADHWAWQAIKKPTVPEVQQQSWSSNPVDQFILAKLEDKGLPPTESADKEVLIRRATFDLTGLPPTVEEIDQFLSDESEEAFAKLVDRLLDSPAFGEHWGRHWLDVARYGESTGSSRNVPYPHAWRYRDYVIKAFQQDKPYNVFVQEQIAGDLLPYSSQEERDEQLTATGFLALGVKDVNQRFRNRFILDNIDEQIDTVSQSILALTVSCARCHDHKFDPIPTTDYYALVGIFQSTDLCAGVRNRMGGSGLDYYDSSLLLKLGSNTNVQAVPSEQVAEFEAKLEKARAEFRRLQQNPEGAEKAPNGRTKRQVARQRMNRLQQELMALTDPAASGPVAFGVQEAQVISDAEIRVRGEPERYGPVVSRGFLGLFAPSDVPSIPAHHSGRLELANWLTHPQNPMTTRVFTNRVWGHLFGQGLVTTVDNFGVNGDHPSHPELLDHLALRFVELNYSTKGFIRELLLTKTYQMSSASHEQGLAVDPQNRWLWRHHPRRLTAEEIRDTMLLASRKLEKSPPSVSPAAELKVIELRNNGDEARKLESKARDSQHRSVYLPLVRGQVPTSLHVFDFAEQGMVTGHRDETIVAPQALYLLNDPFVREQSQELAIAILREKIPNSRRVDAVYRMVLGRLPNDVERLRIEQYLTEVLESIEQQLLASRQQQSEKAPKVIVAAAEQSTSTVQAAEVIDPDQIVQGDAPVVEKVVTTVDAETTAWASVIQALYGSAEFRYLK